MKQMYVSAAFLIAAAVAQAQQQGTIIYERKADVHRRMEDEQMKAMVPQFQASRHELIFNGQESVYRAVPQDEAPDPFEGGNGPRVMVRIGGPGENGVIYRNYSNSKLVEQTELIDKTYIIDDTLKAQPWKLADETRTIMGHLCKKATLTTERGSVVEAWYAEDMVSPAGPENFGGLPGTILMIDVNKGEIIYTATDISGKADMKILKQPEKGTHTTRAGFQKILNDTFGPPDASGRIIRRF